MRTPILCRDGTIISVQASSAHYCSPRADNPNKGYGCVEIRINDGEVQGWISGERVLALIAEHGGIIGGQLPPLDFGNHKLVKDALHKIAVEGDASRWWEQMEKQAEEAQRRREYGYVHPTVDDYDPMYDDPNYEEPEEPYEGDDEE